MNLPSMDINPNTNSLPSNAAVEKIVGALMRFGLNAAVAGVALSVIARAVGSHSANVLQNFRKCVRGQDVAQQARRRSGAATQLRQATLSDAISIAQFQTECWREADRDLVRRHISTESASRTVRCVGVTGWVRVLARSPRRVRQGVDRRRQLEESDTSDAPASELMSLYVAAGHRGTCGSSRRTPGPSLLCQARVPLV
jgi:hypothetical protein